MREGLVLRGVREGLVQLGNIFSSVIVFLKGVLFFSGW